MTTMPELYAECVEAVASLAGSLSEEDLARPVPATPDWTVHHVLAHLAGCGSDNANGRMDGAPAPSWSHRHVGERIDRTPAELVAELRTNSPAVQASAHDNPRPALVWDISVHLADLHEALDHGRPDEELWHPVLAMAAPWKLGALRATVRAGDDAWGSGPDVEVDPYELFRALFSRRSRAQMQAWGAPELSDVQLDELPVFGPRDDDQPQPN